MFWVPSRTAAEELSREQAREQLQALLTQTPVLDKQARLLLEQLGADAKQEFIARQEELTSGFGEWDENLDLPAPPSFNIEQRRTKLREDVAFWTATIDTWDLAELKEGIADGLVIADADGLDVVRLNALYELTKRIIRTGDFVPPDTSTIGNFDTIELSTSNKPSTVLFRAYMTFWGMGSLLEEMEAHARKEHQDYRRRLYKRAVVAYIRVLISGDQRLPDCARTRPLAQADMDGNQVQVLGCRDQVVDNLRAYAQAVQKIQSADTLAFTAEAASLVAEQQLIADSLNALPVVGDVLDIYGVLYGQDIAGQCLSPEERGMAAVFLALPLVGPAAMRQVKRLPGAEAAIARTQLFLELALEESRSALTYAYREMGFFEFGERVAGYWGTNWPAMQRLEAYFNSFRPELSGKAKADMVTFRNVRDALDARQWRDALPEEALEEARRRSAKVMRENLEAVQGSRAAVIKSSNMVSEHVEALQKVAAERDEILIYRYVNPNATELIDAGARTKHMGIKAKSAERGPIAGLLPVNQSLNKQGSRLQDLEVLQKTRPLNKAESEEVVELTKGMKKGAQNIEDCLAKPADCAIAVEYPVRNPKGEGHVLLQVVNDEATGQPVYFIRDEGGRMLDPTTGNPLEVVPTGTPEPVLVLADPATGSPLTADYDLLSIGLNERKYAGVENLPDGLDPNLMRRADGGDLTNAHGVPEFDDRTGFTTPQVRETLEATNQAVHEVQRAQGLEPFNISHHGAERWYPFSPGALDVDPFVTVLDPKKGPLRIPRCDTECMEQWCRKTGQCNPAAICPAGQFENCIPPDADRLLKDYFHDRRLNHYDLAPNPMWSWGNYNPGGGWTFSSYMEAARTKQLKKKLAAEQKLILQAPLAGKFTIGELRKALPAPPPSAWKMMERMLQIRITKNSFEFALPKCTERAN